LKFYVTDGDLKAVENYISSYTRKNEGFSIEVKAVKDARSLAQNNIYWVLISAIGRKMGEFKVPADVILKKAYMKEYGLTEWLETHSLDTTEMSQVIDYTFWFLMNVAEGYLDETEGMQWLKYKEINY